MEADFRYPAPPMSIPPLRDDGLPPHPRGGGGGLSPNDGSPPTPEGGTVTK